MPAGGGVVVVVMVGMETRDTDEKHMNETSSSIGQMKTGRKREDDPLADLLPDEQDLLYEEELLRNPYATKTWLRYINAKKADVAKKRFLLYERALQALPGSYKVR